MKRLKKLIEWMQELDLDLFIIENPIDLFYFVQVPIHGILLVHAKNSTLFLDGRYISAFQKEKCFKIKAISTFSVDPFKKTKMRIGFDSAITSYERFLKLKTIVKAKGTLVAQSGFLRKLRSVKDADEIKKITHACKVNMQTFNKLIRSIKVGMTEIDLVKKIKQFYLNFGDIIPSFDPIVAFGKNSAIAHHTPSTRKLKVGDVILIDMGCIVDHYASDMTRILFFKKTHPKLLKFFELVNRAKESVCTLLKPGVPLRLLDSTCRQIFKRAKVENLFTHSLSHGVGLEIHEYPFIRKTSASTELLECGQVITIEPGLYDPNIGGIRLEDQVVITKNGFKNLTPAQKKPILIM
ncbi:MAG: putative peptidase [Chlamydiae bacterium]|nr:putative peptidase [Chlamydiota bacterium]